MPPPFEGRGEFPGPLRGGYILFTGNVEVLINSQSVISRFVCPCDLRIMEVSVIAEATGSDPTIRVQGGPTGSLVQIVAAVNLAAASAILTITPTSTPALLDAVVGGIPARTLAKGDELVVTLAADGGDTMGDGTFTITCYTRGHVVALATND